MTTDNANEEHNDLNQDNQDNQDLNTIIQLAEFARKAKDFPEFEYSIYTGVKNKLYHLLLSEYNVCESDLERSAMLMALTPALLEFKTKRNNNRTNNN